MNRRFLFIFSSILLFGLVGLIGWFLLPKLFPRPPLASPLSRFGYIEVSDPPLADPQSFEVLGFVPYWTLQQASVSPVMTDVAYFSIVVGADGSIAEVLNGERELGWSRMQGESFLEWLETRHEQGQRVHITVVSSSNEAIAQLMASEKNRQNAVFSLQQLLISYPFDAVQLDFEYAGEASPALRAQYVTFVQALDVALAELNPNIAISVAVFGSSPEKPLFWDIAALEPHVDFFVFMAYDYHVRSSSTVGPVAPIFGKSAGRWEHDIVTNLRSLLKLVPAKKVLLGIPFYGYEWSATNDSPGATTYPKTGATATYERVMALLQDSSLGVRQQWDADALSPYLTFQESGRTQVIYYEDVRSLGYKLDLVRQLGLRGVAIWAVGYEGESQDLWDVIGQKLRTL